MDIKVAVLALVLLGVQADGARILGMLPMWAASHHRFTQPVMKALADAGHEVVVYSPFPLTNAPDNYRTVKLNISTENPTLSQWLANTKIMPQWKCYDRLFQLKDLMFSNFIDDPQVKALLESDEKFDLIFTESLFLQEFALILGHVFNAPVICVLTIPPTSLVKSVFGNPIGSSYMPDLCLGLSNEMTIIERTLNIFLVLRAQFAYYNIYLPHVEENMKTVFPGMPPLTDLLDNISLVFSNNHPTAYYPEPLVPNIVSIAGIHIQEPSSLPSDIQRFMDDAPAGVILFSLGTYVADELLPQSYFDMYINVFKKLPQRVLWKTRNTLIKGLPPNVLTKSWIPQADILGMSWRDAGHPNCVLFITHGGLHSMYEAMDVAVPVVVIPQFGDQFKNARHLEHHGVGITLDANTLSENTISEALQRVLEDPSFRSNMHRLSAIFRDRPLSPAQTVVYWTEYVLRHAGAPHLRTAATRLRWYQLALLDVLAFILMGLIVILTLVFLITKRVIAALRIAYTANSDKKQR